MKTKREYSGTTGATFLTILVGVIFPLWMLFCLGWIVTAADKVDDPIPTRSLHVRVK